MVPAPADRPRFVIVGAGTTAHAAIEALTLKVPDAEIVIVSDEKTMPRCARASAPRGAVASSRA